MAKPTIPPPLMYATNPPSANKTIEELNSLKIISYERYIQIQNRFYDFLFA
jgi:hypothetical protein